MIEPVDLSQIRKLALAWLEHACNGEHGRPEKGDAVYDAVTEHRDIGKTYSSCGDLAHWLLFRLGVRSPWINRAEFGGWRVGANISRLAWSAIARPARPADHYEAGDVLIIWSKPDTTDSHALVVREHLTVGPPQGTVIRSADYGQPGGKYRERAVVIGPHSTRILGGRTIQRVLPLADVMARAWTLGQLAAPELPPAFTPPAAPELVS